MTIAFAPVKSSNIEAIGHDGTHTHVKFKSGEIWKYPTTASQHASLLADPSISQLIAIMFDAEYGEKVG